MKKIEVFLIICFIQILFSITLKVNAQKYYPFPESNAIWSERAGSSIDEPVSYFRYYYTLTRDTVINTFTYKIIIVRVKFKTKRIDKQAQYYY